MLCYSFSLEAVLQGVLKNNPTKKEIGAEIQAILKHISKIQNKTLVPESPVPCLINLQTSGNFIKKEALAQVFFYEFCEIFKNTFFIEHLRWLLFEYVFIWISSVTSKVSVAGFHHVFVCRKRYRITTDILQILEVHYPANKYSESTTETLKQDVKSAKS